MENLKKSWNFERAQKSSNRDFIWLQWEEIKFKQLRRRGAGEGNALWKHKRLNNVIRFLNKSSKTLLHVLTLFGAFFCRHCTTAT